MPTDSGRKTGNFTTDQKGSVMLELVFAVTVLTVVFLTAVTFSMHYKDYYGVQKVAGDGAMEASLTGNVEWARTKAYQSAWLWGLDPGRLSVEFHRGGRTVTCFVTYSSAPFHKNFPTLLGGAPLSEITFNARAVSVWLGN